MEHNEKDLELFQDMNCMRLYKIINMGGGSVKHRKGHRL